MMPACILCPSLLYVLNSASKPFGPVGPACFACRRRQLIMAASSPVVLQIVERTRPTPCSPAFFNLCPPSEASLVPKKGWPCTIPGLPGGLVMVQFEIGDAIPSVS